MTLNILSAPLNKNDNENRRCNCHRCKFYIFSGSQCGEWYQTKHRLCIIRPSCYPSRIFINILRLHILRHMQHSFRDFIFSIKWIIFEKVWLLELGKSSQECTKQAWYAVEQTRLMYTQKYFVNWLKLSVVALFYIIGNCMNIFTYILTTEIINCNHMYNCFPHCLLCKCLHYRPILQCYFCYLFISAFLISKHPCKLTHSNTLFTNHLLSERWYWCNT